MHIAVGKKWDAAMVASKLEAFAIAGCDVISTYAISYCEVSATTFFRPQPHIPAEGYPYEKRDTRSSFREVDRDNR